jgi:hypothetical protein
MAYSFSSVLNAIQENNNLSCDPPLPHCPKFSVGWCQFKPEDCSNGSHQNCDQKLTIFTGKAVRILYFFFQVSANNFDGFIDENDNQLNLLIRGNFIQRKIQKNSQYPKNFDKPAKTRLFSKTIEIHKT